MVADNHKLVLLTYIIKDVFLIDPDGDANVQQKLQVKAAHSARIHP